MTAFGNRFGQFDGTVHGGDVADLDLDTNELIAVGATGSLEFFEVQFADTFALDSSAEFLSHLVSGDFDVVKMRKLATLLDGLKLHCQFRGLLQTNVTVHGLVKELCRNDSGC